MILPLFGGFSELDLLNAVLGKPKVDGPELVQETFRASKPPGDLATAWTKFLHDGFASHILLRDQPPAFNGNTAGGIAHNLWSPPGPAPTPESPEIVLVAIIQSTTAVTSITAGSRKCPTRSPN